MENKAGEKEPRKEAGSGCEPHYQQKGKLKEGPDARQTPNPEKLALILNKEDMFRIIYTLRNVELNLCNTSGGLKSIGDRAFEYRSLTMRLDGIYQRMQEEHLDMVKLSVTTDVWNLSMAGGMQDGRSGNS